MVYGIRIQEDSVYCIWYNDSEGFNMVYGFGRIQYIVNPDIIYNILNPSESVYHIESF